MASSSEAEHPLLFARHARHQQQQPLEPQDPFASGDTDALLNNWRPSALGAGLFCPDSSDDEAAGHAAQRQLKRKRGRPKKLAQANSIKTHVVPPAQPQGQLNYPNTLVQDGMISLSAAVDLGLACPGDMTSCADTGFDVKIQNGYKVASPNMMPLCYAMAAAKGKDNEFDQDYLKLDAAFFRVEGQFHHIVARAGDLGLSRRTCSQKLRRLANAQHLTAKHARHLLERVVSSHVPRQHRIVYIDAVAYDETPMRTSTRGESQALGLGAEDQEEPVEPIEGHALITGLSTSIRHTAISKILQSRHSFGMLVKDADGHIHIKGHTVTPLQAMQRGTGEVLMQCLLSSSGVSEAAGRFKLCSRLASTDRNGANNRAEHLMIDMRGGPWRSLQHHCEVHKTANTLNRTLDHLLPEQVRGMPQACLCFELP